MFLDFMITIRDVVLPTCINWATRIYAAIGNALPYILAIFFISLATRFLLMPIIAGKLFTSGSDRARSKKE